MVLLSEKPPPFKLKRESFKDEETYQAVRDLTTSLETLREAITKAVNDALVPIGSIISWVGGYFADGSNGSYTAALGSANTVAAANTLLNPFGWYVCNGAALNDPDSLIFNGAGRYLPNLTDDRFLMGDTVVGGIGGSNTISPSAHGITQPTFTGPSHRHGHGTLKWYCGSTDAAADVYMLAGDESTIRVTTQTAIAAGIGATPFSAYAGLASKTFYVFYDSGQMDLSGNGACSIGTSVGLSNNHSSEENRPKYLSCFYIIRVR